MSNNLIQLEWYEILPISRYKGISYRFIYMFLSVLRHTLICFKFITEGKDTKKIPTYNIKIQIICFPFLPFCTIPYKLCNKKAQICCLISMETTIFATVLRSGEVSLHILVQKGACMSFPCLRWVCPDSRYGWRLNVLPMLWQWTVQVERFSPFCLFCLEYVYFHI